MQAEVALAKQREESQKVQISHLTQLADTLRTDLDVSKKATASLQAEKEQGQRHAAQLSRSLQLSEESVADLTANAVSLDAQHKEAMSKQEALVAQLMQALVVHVMQARAARVLEDQAEVGIVRQFARSANRF